MSLSSDHDCQLYGSCLVITYLTAVLSAQQLHHECMELLQSKLRGETLPSLC